MRKWELVSSIVLALLGLGVMAGQGFEFNVWVFLFWGAAVLLALVTWMHREPSGHPTALSGPRGHEPSSSTLAMLHDMGVRFDKPDGPRIYRDEIAEGRWGTWIAGRFVLDEPARIAEYAVTGGGIMRCDVPGWVPSGALVSVRYEMFRPAAIAIRRSGSSAEPQRLSGTGSVELVLSEASQFEVVAEEPASFTLWVLGWTRRSKP